MTETDEDEKTSDNWIIGGCLLAAFIISVVGDQFFEHQWTNPSWYLFEFINIGIWISLMTGLIYFRDRHEPADKTEEQEGEQDG